MKNLIGNNSVVSSLRRAVSSGEVGHAYIFSGERGTGKKTLANAFAKAVQCENTRGGEACGVCRSCRLFDERRHPDVIYVKGTKTKSIGVDDVREQIKHPMQSKPFEFRHKIIIVDEAEIMTPQAQNALLKIIEEPPSYGVFIFLAAYLHTILPTVLSRCAAYTLKPVTDEEARAAVIRAGLSPEGTEFAGGNIGKAIEMASSEDFAEKSALVREIAAASETGIDILTATNFYKRFEEHKDSTESLLDMLYLTFSARRGLQNGPKTVQCVDAVVRAKKTLERNGNHQLAIELMLIELGGKYDGNRSTI